MICSKCGNQLPDGFRFCYFCGAVFPYPGEAPEDSMRLAKEQHSLYTRYSEARRQADEAYKALMGTMQATLGSGSVATATQAQQTPMPAAQQANSEPETAQPMRQDVAAGQPQPETEAALPTQQAGTAIEPQQQAVDKSVQPVSQPTPQQAAQATSFCGNCGAQLATNARFCLNCGAQAGQLATATVQSVAPQTVQASIQPPEPKSYPSEAVCPKCSGHNTTIQVVETGQRTTRKGVGLGGHVNNAARAATAVATLGLSNLAWKKSEGTNKTKTINVPMRVCLDCGYMWEARSSKSGFAPISIFR